MKILAVEFSSARRSIAITEGILRVPHDLDSPLAVTVLSSLQAEDHDARGLAALGLVEQALQAAGLEREQIEAIAVGLGPGSYTGIRAAIALARGWQLARLVQLTGLGSMDCLAAQASALGWTDRLHLLVDAQRGEFYYGAYELASGSAQVGAQALSATPSSTRTPLPAGTWRCLEPLRIITPAEASIIAASPGILAGPEIHRWFPQGRLLFPDAAMLGRLVAAAPVFAAHEPSLEPIYLRPTQYVKAPPLRVTPN